MNLNEKLHAILNVLDENVGWRTGDVAETANVYQHLGKRIASAWARNDLIQLERLGLAGRLDNQKPVCWVRTLQGTALIKRSKQSIS